MRFDHALPVVRDMVRKDPQMLGYMARLFEAERHGKVQALLALEDFCAKICCSLNMNLSLHRMSNLLKITISNEIRNAAHIFLTYVAKEKPSFNRHWF